MKIEINSGVLAELEYMVKLHQEHGAPAQMDSVERLVGYVLACVADGSRRPGSWERGMLMQMGLIADCDDHHIYRSNYGEPGAAVIADLQVQGWSEPDPFIQPGQPAQRSPREV